MHLLRGIRISRIIGQCRGRTPPRTVAILFSVKRHTPHPSTCQQTSAEVSIRQHTPAYASIRQHVFFL